MRHRWGTVLCSGLLLAAVGALAPAAMAQNLDFGERYDSIDALTKKQVLYTEDAVIEVERQANGTLEAMVRPVSQQAPLALSYGVDGQVDVRSSLLEKGTARIQRSRVSHGTIDWVGLQAYLLWDDLKTMNRFPVQAERLDWSGSFARPAGAVRFSREDPQERAAALVGRVVAVESEFEGYRAVSRLTPSNEDPAPGVAVSTFETRLIDLETGIEVGLGRYFANAQLWSWDVLGISHGNVTPKEVPAGQWFEPNMAWANVQLFGFQHLYGDSLFENEAGCDNLHYVDGSFFQKCCDRHDRCFEKNGCTAKSWWTFAEGWRCVKCNITVVACFLVSGSPGGVGPYPDPNAGPSACTDGGYCPPTCLYCSGPTS